MPVLTPVLLFSCVAAAVDPARSAGDDRMPDPHGAMREQTERPFKNAVMWKPRPGSAPGIEQDLAPLILEEGGSEPSELAFGLVVFERQGRPRVDPTVPTVYAGTRKTVLAGEALDEVTYLWAYGRAESDGSGLVCTCGVRLVLGHDGFPLVWEILSWEAGRPDRPQFRRLFVAESLETAARERFGDPLPGRRYAIEASLKAAPDAVVLGVLPDGPVPMGPYVYLDAADRRVTRVLCRCSPSEVENIRATPYYELAPLEELGLEAFLGLIKPGSPARGLEAGDAVGPAGASDRDSDRRRALPDILRWPHS